MKSLFTAAAVAGVLAFSATSAQAVTYDFTGMSSGQQNTYTYGDLTVGAGHYHTSGGAVHSNITGDSVDDQVTRAYWGHGIDSDISGGGQDSDNQVDGSGDNDVLVFKFGTAVTLVSVRFSYFGSDDEFSYFFDGDGNGNLDGDILADSLNPNGAGSNYTFGGTYFGTLFGIGAVDSNDEFRVRSITVSAVPVPAALPLFGAALLGMGFLARRRKQKAAMKA
jgi:hypothetical protein